MNIETFIPIAQTEACRRFAFLGLAYELTRAECMFFYDTPCYHDPNRGLSIVITYAGGHDYLELCILAMGHKPIAEAGPVRVVMFPSANEKEAFKTEFSKSYEKILIDFATLGGMHPIHYFLMTCNPQSIELINQSSTHAVRLSIDINSELSKILWIEEIKKISEFIWEDEKQFSDDNNWQHMQITFRGKKARDRYVRKLVCLKQEFLILKDSIGHFPDKKL